MRLYMAAHLVCAGVYSRIIAVGGSPLLYIPRVDV